MVPKAKHTGEPLDGQQGLKLVFSIRNRDWRYLTPRNLLNRLQTNAVFWTWVGIDSYQTTNSMIPKECPVPGNILL